VPSFHGGISGENRGNREPENRVKRAKHVKNTWGSLHCYLWATKWARRGVKTGLTAREWIFWIRINEFQCFWQGSWYASLPVCSYLSQGWWSYSKDLWNVPNPVSVSGTSNPSCACAVCFVSPNSHPFASVFVEGAFSM